MTMTVQEAFTKSVEAIVKQGFQCSQNGGMQCFYADPDRPSAGCAVGILLPRDIALRLNSKGGWNDVLGSANEEEEYASVQAVNFLGRETAASPVIGMLQRAHDSAKPDEDFLAHFCQQVVNIAHLENLVLPTVVYEHLPVAQ